MVIITNDLPWELSKVSKPNVPIKIGHMGALKPPYLLECLVCIITCSLIMSKVLLWSNEMETNKASINDTRSLDLHLISLGVP